MQVGALAIGRNTKNNHSIIPLVISGDEAMDCDSVIGKVTGINRRGTKPSQLQPDRHPSMRDSYPLNAMSSKLNQDGATVIPIVNILEGDKMEYLEAHIRIMDNEGNELELLRSLDGIRADKLEVEKICAYADKKWPPKLRTFVDAKSK